MIFGKFDIAHFFISQKTHGHAKVPPASFEGMEKHGNISNFAPDP
jgi:hypothetical protein